MFLEYVLIGIIICLQFFLAYQLWIRIQVYKNIYAQKAIISYEGEEKDKIGNPYKPKGDEIALLYSNSKNEIFIEIISTINKYLKTNKGATTDFHLLKDIVDRNIDTLEEEISNRIPSPLYLGLVATMLGIIFGLMSMDDPNSQDPLSTISGLIDGVKVAMFASVFGLAITTLFSIWINKDARKKVEEDKNQFLSFLQTELLPLLFRSEGTGINALNQRIDKFGRNMYPLVQNLEGMVTQTSKSVEQEQILLAQIKKMDFRKLSQSNIAIFQQMDGMMDDFRSFTQYYSELNRSLGQTVGLTENLTKFVSKTKDVSEVLSGIKKIVNSGQNSIEFFNSHIKSFDNYSDAVNIAVADSDSAMQKALESLKSSVIGQLEAYQVMVADAESKMDGAFNQAIEGFKATTDTYILNITKAFEEARPRFEKLEKLDYLELLNPIVAHLEKIGTEIPDSVERSNAEVGIKMDALLKVFEQNLEETILLKETLKSIPVGHNQPLNVVSEGTRKKTVRQIENLFRWSAYLTIVSFGMYSLWAILSSYLSL